MSRELRLRIISGVVMAVVVLLATWHGGSAFRLLASVIGLLIYYEWSTITGLRDRDFPGAALGWLAVGVIVIATLARESVYAVGALLLFTVLSMGLVAARRKSWWLPAGIVYAGLTVIAMSEIRDDDFLGFVLMLFVFATVWATDILAYFVGRALRGPKLAPRISPGKTWSGAAGGTLAAVIIGPAVVWCFFPGTGLRVVFVALLLSVCSQAGDLFESFIKRRFGVKDSGDLIPGHGGVMDRADGLVFACFAGFLLAIVLSLMAGGEMSSLGGVLLGV
ncbi:phosphatidate cytidylyltransferase [Rhizobium tumorigenes]|uniref:Phosphatidate cytidylyltransferase n=1 Tax=Rhizobium tumorigenes TaxID=2041385 RepID=A0AAF1KAH0_9HYPH|nr:phosphatidate cytidylyltransferase [Rhizobium tumorigenes]WFR96706.1 phosphatidate cytidylyltransferase [Rhizobium tumorigenes]